MSTSDTNMHLIHGGSFAKTIPLLPEIISFSLFEDDNDVEVTAKQATSTMLGKYPMLRSKLVSKKGEKGEPQVWAEKGFFPNSVDDFFVCVDLTDKVPSPKGLTASAVDKYLNKHVIHRQSDPMSAKVQMKKGCRLFHVALYKLPEKYFCLSLVVSHGLVDGAAYFHLSDEFIAHMNGETLSKPDLTWDHPLITRHESYDGERDLATMSGPTFLFGALVCFLRTAICKRSHTQLTLDKEKIAQLKKELKKEDTPFLSTNDIVCAAIHQAYPKRHLQLMFKDRRSDVEGGEPHIAGNFISTIAYPTEYGKDPNNLRKMVQKGSFYETDEIPSSPILRGNYTIVDSWASVQKDYRVFPSKTKGVYFCPHPMFIMGLPYDIAIIYNMDEKHIGISHNLYHSHTKRGSVELLEKMIA